MNTAVDTRTQRPRRALLLALTLLLISAGAEAQPASAIYRCHRLDGQLVFQDKPCDQAPDTREARSGSAGTVIPNAPPAPESDGPSLTQRYEQYLDKQAAREAAKPAVEESGTETARAARAGGAAPASAGIGLPVYEEGFYPYPVYPYPAYGTPVRPRPPIQSGGAQTPPIPAMTPLPTILPAPGLSFSRPPPRTNPPGRVVPKDPAH